MKPAERTLEVELLGQRVTFDYSETWLGYSMLGLRLVMAWVILQAGLDKLAEGGWANTGAWSATDFLIHGVPDGNPLQDVFLVFAEYL